MAVNLSAGGFFNPQVQEALFMKGLNGTDLRELQADKDVASMRQYQQQQANSLSEQEIAELDRMSRITSMVDNGDLVPKNTYGQPQSSPNQPDRQGYMSYDSRTEPNSGNSSNDEFERLFGNNNQSRSNDPVNAPSFEDAIRENVTKLNNAAVKRGYRGEEVINFIQNLKEDDYLNLYEMQRQAQSQQYQPQYQPQPQLQWVRNDVPSYGGSIASMPSHNVNERQGSQSPLGNINFSQYNDY